MTSDPAQAPALFALMGAGQAIWRFWIRRRAEKERWQERVLVSELDQLAPVLRQAIREGYEEVDIDTETKTGRWRGTKTKLRIRIRK